MTPPCPAGHGRLPSPQAPHHIIERFAQKTKLVIAGRWNLGFIFSPSKASAADERSLMGPVTFLAIRTMTIAKPAMLTTNINRMTWDSFR
ncbi:MAG: hypothetical protein Ct9H300mP16_01650 [Pseudomonadota bacterium]|nr:MAG: hypothetical protein Ct9H300mP16_01650 [Pseudomonadota bacterium]